ncbi:KPN_02809 family neutral zinc metallopeptidase [Nakamurella endophytica]|uniref:Membrane protein n=1 Tax=Nakamurella endophytica TaxID=1748367 RepID=A0A917TAF7_9ACTN|nr:neutral zinc metallopeptidase [Nakamurella endophytica]GGM16283.1 membrane protein [Nakamurella endophytica]
MRFNDNAGLDVSQVEDRRGGGGGGGIGLGGGLAAGGGGLGLVGLLVIVLMNVFGGSGGGPDLGQATSGSGYFQQAGAGGGTGTFDDSQLQSECRTGADANTNDDCAVVAIINSVQAFWSQQLARSGTTYTESDTVFFAGSTPTGCGTGQTGMGPFYCPSDRKVYIDLSFWDTLRSQFGADAGPFTQAYVLAHEYGHHVQDLLGTNSRVGTATGPTSGSVRLELQADCYAGVWANHASTTAGPDGQVLIQDITQQDLANAVATAGKIGDDYIQTHLGSGSTDPSSYTHGTSAQRQKWFQQGYTTGNPASCNTFDTSNLG